MYRVSINWSLAEIPSAGYHLLIRLGCLKSVHFLINLLDKDVFFVITWRHYLYAIKHIHFHLFLIRYIFLIKAILQHHLLLELFQQKHLSYLSHNLLSHPIGVCRRSKNTM